MNGQDDEHQPDQQPPDQQPERGLATQRAGTIQRRDFGGASLAVTNPVAEAMAAQERAMVEARYIMATRRPREIDDVRTLILQECRRPGFADVATYARPVGKERLDEDGPRGKRGEWVDVFAEGLSIRFAEVALRRMGNMSATARTLHDDAAVRMVQITALDYESGGSWEIVITVTKTVEQKSLRKGQRPLGERTNSYGDRVFIVEANEQRFAAKLAAEISKASRTAILRLVPGEIQDEAFELCKNVAKDRDAKDPSAAKKRMLDGFAERGVRPAEVVQWLGHPVEQGTREEFLALSKILAALREGELVWSELLSERLSDRAAASAAAAAQTGADAGAARAATTAAPVATTQPQTTPAAKPAAPTRPSGKGAAALRGALAKNGGDQREAEPGWMAKSGDPTRRIPATDMPPEEQPQAGNELRRCASEGCNAVVEVLIADPAGSVCYACSAAKRDSE